VLRLLYGKNFQGSRKMQINRNSLCPCGSGKKYKNCCYAKDAKEKLFKTRYVDPTTKKMARYKMRDLIMKGSKKDVC